MSNAIEKTCRYLLLSLIVLIPISFYPTYMSFGTPKWVLIYSMLGSLSLLSVLSKKVFYVPFAKRPTFMLISLFLLSMFTNWPGYYFQSVTHWLGTLLIIFFSYNYLPMGNGQFSFNVGRWVSVASVPVILLALLDAKMSPASSLGNPNFLAVLLGFLLLIQVYHFSLNKKWIRLIIPVATAFIIVLTCCRSVMIALTIAFCFLGKSWKKKLLILLIVCGAFAAITDKKIGGIEYRFALVVNSVMVSLNNPLTGVGPNKFISAYGEYKNYKKDTVVSDSQLEKHPHNTYVETAAENGIPFLLVLIGVFLTLFLRLIQYPSFNRERALFLSMFIYFTVELTFSFSLQRPSMYYLFAFFLGQLFSFMNVKRYRLSLGNSRILFLCTAIVFATLAYNKEFSHRAFRKYGKNLNAMTKVCKVWPNWIFCMRKGELELFSGKFKEAEKTFEDILLHHPNFYPPMGRLGQVRYVLGREEEGCKLLKDYKNILQRKSHLDNFIQRFCHE